MKVIVFAIQQHWRSPVTYVRWKCLSKRQWIQYRNETRRWRVADLPGRRSLRSTDSNRMVVPSVRLSTVANRAFPVVGPQIWNDLPAEVTSAESLTTFRQRLKTHPFFQNHFPATSWTLTNFPGHYLYILYSGLSSGF